MTDPHEPYSLNIATHVDADRCIVLQACHRWGNRVEPAGGFTMTVEAAERLIHRLQADIQAARPLRVVT